MEKEIYPDLDKFVLNYFYKSVLPNLMEFIKIPNLSKSYDPEWNTNGLLEKAASHIKNWVDSQNLKGIKQEIIKEKNRTPLLIIEVEGSDNSDSTILFYGHFDKQPYFSGWNEGLGPINPIIRNGKLYGRGSVDDGYAIYLAITAIKSCQELNINHPRCVILIEGDEESEGEDLPYYLDQIDKRIGKPDLVICLDSGCLDYERFCLTTSLRGCIEAKLTVGVLKEGVHSGEASGVIPSSFRIIRQLLDRLECPLTGKILDDSFYCTIPPSAYNEAFELQQQYEKNIKSYPFLNGVQLTTDSKIEGYLNRIWRPQLSYTGIDGFPAVNCAGNVLRPFTTIKISLRLPPLVDGKIASQVLKEILEKNPPYNSHVKLYDISPCNGWFSKNNNPKIIKTIENIAQNCYGKNIANFGEGGSIPFVNLLGNKYPDAFFIVTGLCGPESNAHGPNESLDIEGAKKLFRCITNIVSNSSNFLKK